MDFAEQVKKEIREKAAFRCCRCQQVGIHVHHIIPQENGGSSNIDNAAPLCPSCHDYFGSNPQKRKEITQMRNWWYGQVKMQFPDNRQLSRLEDINNKLDKLQQDQINLNDFKQELREFSNNMINNITKGTAASTATGIANASMSPSASTSVGPSGPPLSPSMSPSPSEAAD